MDDYSEINPLEVECDELAASVERLIIENSHLSMSVKRLRQENKQLAASIERLRWAVEHPEHISEWHRIINETPTQSIAEIRAQAVEESARLYTRKMTDEFQSLQIDIIRNGMGFIYPEGLLEYAQSIRQAQEGSDGGHQ